MNQEIKNIITIGLVFIVLFYATGMSMVHVHEQAHKEIYRTYGVESEIKYDWIKISGYTQADYLEAQEKCNELCELAHNQNEIVGYHMSGLVSVLVFLFCIYLMFKLIGGKNGRKETLTDTV